MTSSSNTEEPLVREGQRPPFERIALLLQGGGALGAYQAGVYEALTEANLDLDWVAGISIGAVNAALIAGNAPEKRVERLREFWEAVSTAPLGVPYLKSIEITNELTRRFVNQSRALGIMLFGAPNFFTPRVLPPLFWSAGSASSVSYYDVAPLKTTLERLVDFDRINSERMRFSVGAVNVRTGNFLYFDNRTHRICPAHIIASGSLPPGFPATEIEGEYYWDGGLVSNTPLQWMLENRPHEDTLAFQVDLWSADGELPDNLQEAEVRQKEIQYSSRTRAATNQFKYAQMLRRAFRKVLSHLPDDLLTTPEVEILAREADEKVYNIVHLIYHSKAYEGASKDYEFSRRTMEEHWKSGYDDAVRSLGHPEVFQRPDNPEGVRTFDYCKKRSD
ncbi:NTE family protein [Bradyrhizobium shewense]|uniref:NTE family protein n=1 Tax=Bradyrhizobium shewense TaxID=1761772 RepID=A0A1C3XNT7_9BRAD|nr:patatin-like phospholipase family protein [Bradyrhizobium shewense]SCB53815.1 NTE family protein [Bradyrhizobium shewense]